jgi:tetratricopeptide (TPR) repeat protein
LIAVTVVAGCGPETVEDANAPPAAPGASVQSTRPNAAAVLDDEEVVRRVFEAAADGDRARLPERLTPRVSLARVAVVALHDQLLGRQKPTPELPAVLDALEALGTREGGVDRDALAPLAAAWRGWTDEQRAVEIELARLVSIANAAFTLPGLPGPDGLREIVKRADEQGPAPPMSPAGAAISFFRYAAGGIAAEQSPEEDASVEDLKAARAAFDALGWPGGFAVVLEPLAVRLLDRDPSSIRGTFLWTEAERAYRDSGDDLRVGMMNVSRARAVWRGQPDGEAVRRAALLAENARTRITATGLAGRELYEACSVHAYALQAAGEHDDALAAAAAAAELDVTTTPEERAELLRMRAISFFRTGRYTECLSSVEDALTELGPDHRPEIDEARVLVPALQELAAQAHLELGEPAKAAPLLLQVAEFHQRESGKPWASDQMRVEALLLRARALARAGDADAARASIRELLGSSAQAPRQLALAADVLLEAGFVDDAEDVVGQAEKALGPDRAALFGELRGRIAATRGDLPAARVAFRGAIDFVTGGDSTRRSWSASRIFESWARVEERAGNRDRARELYQTAANHLIEAGVDHELKRLLAEVKRLQSP